MTRWTETFLTAMRQVGDPEVDDLVEAVLPKDGSQSIGRLGYNRMLDLADQLLAAPSLTLVQGSRLSTHLREMPADLVDYFDPMAAPDWVDAEKLKVASQVWTDNTLPCLALLYSASLPACYLTKRGIPALYQTKKLRDKKYLFQRIYETGTFLEEVMDPGGFEIVADVNSDDEQLVVQALNALDPDGRWKHDGRHFRRTEQSDAPALDEATVQAEVETHRGTPRRYIWGRGYITTKKVRFLHASMRFMLTQPAKVRPFGSEEHPESFSENLSHRQTPYNSEELGVPVNQEDLAYTLMTFSLLLPKGLEDMGIQVTPEQKQAFLHLWRVVGYVLGIKPELMTDDWDEAEELYALIQKRQALPSEDGTVLTEALMGFLVDYLPDIPGIANRLSAEMIISQIGLEQAKKILRPELVASTRAWPRRLFYGALGLLVLLYFTIRNRIMEYFPTLGGLTMTRLQEASEQLISSWRGSFVRKAFFVPVNATTWIQKPGTDQAFLDKLRGWRQRLFRTVGVSVALLFLAAFSLAAALPVWFFTDGTNLWTCLGIGVGSWLLSMAILQWWLPTIFKARPKIATAQR